MKKHNPPPAHFPYQRPVSIDVRHAQIAYTSDKVNSAFQLLHDVPSMKLEGDWLEEAGFHCHRIAFVTVEEGCVVIKPEG